MNIPVACKGGAKRLKASLIEGMIVCLIVAIHSRERRGVCAENLAAATPISKRMMNYTSIVDDTKSGILKHKPDEAYRRLQQGFEAFRPAFLYNYKVYYRFIGHSSFVSSIVGLKWSFREGKGFAAPRLFGAFTPPFRRSYCIGDGTMRIRA